MIEVSLYGAELVFPEHQILGAEPHDAGGAVAGRLEGAQLRIDRCDAKAAADQHHMADLLDMLRQAERADEIVEAVARLVVVAHLPRRLAERLDDNGDCALVAVVVGDRQRNPLAALVQADHDEVTGLRRLSDIGGRDLPQERGFGEYFVTDDGIHRGLGVWDDGEIAGGDKNSLLPPAHQEWFLIPNARSPARQFFCIAATMAGTLWRNILT